MHQISAAIHFIFTAYTLMLFARVIGSWFPKFQQFSVMRFVHYYTEPYLKFFRKVIPPLGMVDLSPLIAFVALKFFERLLFAFIR
ncbi:MAG: hypothetical protein S4CHLAM6_05140 [Chlamydiae bacterium]|nr:hypothetical protein [Chlamydiota bacterium]